MTAKLYEQCRKVGTNSLRCNSTTELKRAAVKSSTRDVIVLISGSQPTGSDTHGIRQSSDKVHYVFVSSKTSWHTFDYPLQF